MRFEDQLFLIQTRGLAAEAVWHLASGYGQVGERGCPMDLESAAGRHRALLQLQALGLLRGRELAWPSWPQVRRLGVLLEQCGVRLAWRGGAGYPSRLERAMGQEAPHWVWLAGSAERMDGATCAMIGSRQTAPRFLSAARRLGRALAEAGVAVVSGMAAGADTAAHEGARAGRAGTVAIPALGLLNVLPAPSEMRNAESRMRNEAHNLKSQISNFESAWTWVGLDRPDAPFSAGLAIRRNDVIAALGDALVLVASGLKGGSSYGVRWAIRHGVPLYCFEAGAATPPANASLLRAGLARPLRLMEGETAWVGQIQDGSRRHRAEKENGPRGKMATTKTVGQMEWL